MAQAKIVVNVTDKHGNPLIGMEVELVDTNAFTPANHDPIEHIVDIKTTDISGTATFTGLTPSMYYARPRITRPDIRIQTMMASGIGILCYSAVVDPNGRGTHTTIQAAITALGTGGGTVLICAGTYQENLTIAGNTKDLWLTGISRNCVTIQGTAASPTITVDADGAGALDNFRLEHLTIDHTGAQTLLYFNSVAGGTPIHIDLLDLRFLSGAMGIDMSDLNGGGDFTLRDIIMESTVTNAGQLEVSDLHITNCKFYCAGEGLYISGATAVTGVRVSGCRFGGGSSHALRIGTGNDIQISNCRFLAAGEATKGILVGSVIELVIDGCIIDMTDGIGIDLNSVASAVVISDCSLTCASNQKVGRVGITASGYCSDINISDCRISGFKSYGIELEGVISTGGQQFVIDGVIIKNGEDTHSIYVDGWDYGTITGCVLVGKDVGGENVTYGVYGDAGTTYVVIVANVDRDHDGMTNLTNGVDGNIVGSNTGDGGGMGPLPHDPVTLDANAETLLSLSTQELGLDTQAANLVFAGPAAGGAAVPTFRSLVDADIPGAIARDTEVTTAISDHAGDDDAHHAVFTTTMHTAIGDGAPHHAKYLDSEAIAAVEGEATLDLGGILGVLSGDLRSGAEGTLGQIVIHGEPTGGGAGGLLELHLADDNDAVFAAWYLDANTDNFRIYRSDEVGGNLLLLDPGGNLYIVGSVEAPTLYADAITEASANGGVAIEGVKALDSFLEFAEIAKPANPAGNKLRLYTKDKAGVSTLYYLQDDGTEVEVGAGGGGGATDHIIDADADTEVHVEKTGDVDKVQMKVAGTERFVLQNTTPHLLLTGDMQLTGNLGIGTAPVTDTLLKGVLAGGVVTGIELEGTVTTLDGTISGVVGNVVAMFSAGTTTGKIRGLNFLAGHAVLTGDTVAEAHCIWIRGSKAGGPGHKGTVTEMVGLHYHYPLIQRETVDLSMGIDIERGAVNNKVTDVISIRVADTTLNAGTTKLIQLGPAATPYLEVIGKGGPAGVNSNVIVNFGGVIYMLTRNAATGAVGTAAV